MPLENHSRFQSSTKPSIYHPKIKSHINNQNQAQIDNHHLKNLRRNLHKTKIRRVPGLAAAHGRRAAVRGGWQRRDLEQIDSESEEIDDRGLQMATVAWQTNTAA